MADTWSWDDYEKEFGRDALPPDVKAARDLTPAPPVGNVDHAALPAAPAAEVDLQPPAPPVWCERCQQQYATGKYCPVCNDQLHEIPPNIKQYFKDLAAIRRATGEAA